jgi:hypothetical protein
MDTNHEQTNDALRSIAQKLTPLRSIAAELHRLNELLAPCIEWLQGTEAGAIRTAEALKRR